MQTNVDRIPLSRSTVGFFAYKVSVLICVLFLMRVSTVFGQMFTLYSDVWPDYGDPANPRMVGCGVAQDSGNVYGHSYTAHTTITSPGGQTASADGGQSSTYSEAETSVLWDITETPPTGQQFLVQSTYNIYCPIAGQHGNGNFIAGSGTGVYVGASVSVLVETAVPGFYVKIANCNVHCPVDQYATGGKHLYYCCGSLGLRRQ